jgi:CelD/BcsL family acetyltransferase involved in cellulose biosynthesis
MQLICRERRSGRRGGPTTPAIAHPGEGRPASAGLARRPLDLCLCNAPRPIRAVVHADGLRPRCLSKPPSCLAISFQVIIRVHNSLVELAPYRDAWNRLAGDCAFRTWTWLSTWWRHYGGDGDAATAGERRRQRQLHVVLAFETPSDDSCRLENLVGILPCYTARSVAHGRMVRLLGDGEVCSDHLGLLVDAARAEAVSDALAKHLAEQNSWDLLDSPAIDDDDAPTARLFAALAEYRCDVVAYNDAPTWAIELPATWDEFLALQSKSHRKQLRQAERRVLETGDAVWHPVRDPADFDSGWGKLIDLHQRRRRSLGEPGCFASPVWASFHRDVAPRLLDEGRLRLSWLELNGTPAAAEYHLAGSQTTFAYQGGVDPDRLADEPGRLSTIRAIQQAIAEGHSRFDFLRGDEPYKPHWRATPRATWRYQATAPRVLPKLRRQTWAGARRVGRFAKQLTGLFG